MSRHSHRWCLATGSQVMSRSRASLGGVHPIIVPGNLPGVVHTLQAYTDLMWSSLDVERHGCDASCFAFCTFRRPGMFDVHRARLLNEGWQSQPLANDKGVVGRQNLKEVGGKAPAR
jgi:hypothetical protein